MRRLAQARNPYSLWLWIPGSRYARPGMTSLLRQIIERHGPQAQRQIRLEMQCGNHFAHRQPCYVGERVREQAERGGAGPGLLQHDVLEREAHQFADPRGAVDMRNDLENEVRRL